MFTDHEMIVITAFFIIIGGCGIVGLIAMISLAFGEIE